MKIRFLDAEKDLHLFEEAWEWQFDKPVWWQKLFAIWEESKEEFLEKRFQPEMVFIGIFEKKKFSGLISLEAAGDGIFEAHFDCPRRIDNSLTENAINTLAAHVFEKGAKEIFIFVAEKNRPLLKICALCGFEKTNIGILFGGFRGRVVRWEQLTLKI